MNKLSENANSVDQGDSSDLIERLEKLPPADRAAAIEKLDSVGPDTKVFLLEQFQDVEVIERAAFRPGQHLNIRPVRRRLADLSFDFELEEEIGRGATGSVWKAQDRRLQTTIALKLFEVLDTSQFRARNRVLREAQAASRIISNHVVRIRDVGELQDGTPFIAMELCAEVPADGSSAGLRDIGRNLDKDQPRSLSEAVMLIAQAARGVADAHREGVYHRDLKPANILCRPKARRAEIIDFGLAVPELLPGCTSGRRADQTVSLVIESDTGERVVLAGTPAFMAPEQCQGLPSLVENSDDRERLIRVDVYGLGASLYTLLAGHPPYRPRANTENGALDVVAQVLDGPPPDLGQIPTRFKVPERLKRIIRKAMARNPAERFRSPKELADCLMTFAEDKPTELDKSTFTRLRLWLRRNRTLVRTAASLAAVTIVFVGLWFFSYQRFVEQRYELKDTVYTLESRRDDLLNQKETLTAEKAELAAERDRLKNDLGIMLTISDNLQSIEKTIDSNHRTLDRRQRKIRDDQLNSEILSAELAKTANPLTESIAKIEAQLNSAVTKDQVAAIINDLQDIQAKLSMVNSLKNEFSLVQKQLETTLKAADIKPLVEDLSDLKAQLKKVQAGLNRPKVLLPSPIKDKKGPKPE